MAERPTKLPRPERLPRPELTTERPERLPRPARGPASSHRRGAAAERRIARELGGQRTGNRGRAAPDVVAGWLVVEVKQRAQLPAWLKHAVGQAVASAGPSQMPVAVLHEAGTPYAGALVVMRLADFQDWHGDLDAAGLAEKVTAS